MEASKRSDVQPKLVASAPAVLVARLQTFLSCCSALHFQRIVKNQAGHSYTVDRFTRWYTWPQEWWPSVSATIGDWYPERNLFQLVIAIVSGPRFAMIGIAYLLVRAPGTSLPGFVAWCGFLRTLLCGGWVFITSSDQGDMHDVLMIRYEDEDVAATRFVLTLKNAMLSSYIVMNIPWMLGTLHFTSPTNPTARRWRMITGTLFFASLVPLVYYYIQHKVHRLPGAYSKYALFEWGLILLDVAFDAVSILDVARLEIKIVDNGVDAPAARPYLAPPIPSAHTRKTPAIEQWYIWFDERTSDTRLFLAHSYLAFVFWSNLTVLPIMIFYSSVWSMGLSGEEVLLFVSLSPALLSIRRLRELVVGHQTLFHLVTLIGLAAYQIDDEGEVRLRVLAFAVGVGCLLYPANWWEARAHKAELQYRTVTFGVGLILTLLLRFANFSLNPVWPIMSDKTGPTANGGHNLLGLVLGLASVVELAKHNLPRLTPPTLIVRRSYGSFVFAAFATGSLFFLLHLLYTDSGTIIAWSWEGYPVRGPMAMPHGLWTILACSVGLAAAHLSFVTRAPWFLVACFGCSLLYLRKGWTAFLGGSVLGIWAFSVLPAFIGLAVENAATPGPVFFFAFLIYGVLELAATWTVAYAFVPGGPLLRERTDLVLVAMMACLALGIVELSIRPRAGPDSAAQVSADQPPMARSRQEFHARLRSVLAIGLAVGTVVIQYRSQLVAPSPHRPDSRLITAGIWTVHFAMDGKMWESQRRMAAIIRDAQLDVVGLLESDVQRLVGGNREMTQYIASELNMYADIGPSPSGHTWGCALLSKFPILNSTHHLLPSPAGELAPAIHATLLVYDTLVDVVVAHNGQEEDSLDRELQSKELGRIMSEAWPRPVIFLGYVVTLPHAAKPAPYRYLVEDGRMLDVDPTDMDRWCQYILFRNLERVAYARLNRGSNPAITDTELQLAKFVVPDNTSQLLDPTDSEKPIDNTRARRVTQLKIPDQHRFPDMFYGEGVRGHFYHSLEDTEGKNAPIYYLSEEEELKRQKDWETVLSNRPECQQM
ncbi:BZ3500_MvSof-1268-A1-R1_Chr11-1g03251 [Microbotryum saponariae]|uniref:BZ3500_MvSof-1268-A1-R1_Chr11-1g03251 protein n=1 Tax=Microbotryum saponariae TaxID=289078 RepID=A0A2X0L858_9BASI|nr:BZ3501_MvSof-1269-A2-R1_Chr11g02826 [Microbotryum saponariae]SDA03814.1 BZ3500_MvSof-1268-A1-R1_Chr11-1g03251 [Microbotryum saponariae]